MKNEKNRRLRRDERGGASVKFLIILTALILIANAGYNYIPVAYEGEDLKQEMGTAVVQAMAMPNNANPGAVIKSKIQRIITANNIPPDALVDVKQANNVYQARVAYSQPVKILPFGLYNYVYQFDHTATPTGFLAKSMN